MSTALLTKAFWLKLLIVFVVGYGALCLAVYFGQRRMIYLPSKSQHPLPEGFLEWRSPDGSAHWGFKRETGARECLFFFHGNGGNASGWSHAVEAFPGDVFVLEYPGYGPREGRPTEKSLKAAALQGFETEYRRYKRIYVAGQSLGSAVTEVVFSKYPKQIDRLVLITPFTGIDEVARAHFPWLPTRWMLRDKLRLFDEWQKFPGKTCIVLAGRDEVIPASHNRRYLEASTEACEVIELSEDSHNSIELTRDFWEKAMEG